MSGRFPERSGRCDEAKDRTLSRRRALAALVSTARAESVNEEMSESVTSLLADLRHLCDTIEVNFAEALATSEVLYLAEK